MIWINDAEDGANDNGKMDPLLANTIYIATQCQHDTSVNVGNYKYDLL